MATVLTQIALYLRNYSENRIVDDYFNYPEIPDSSKFVNISVVRKFRITEKGSNMHKLQKLLILAVNAELFVKIEKSRALTGKFQINL